MLKFKKENVSEETSGLREYRKTATVMAIQIKEPFHVETEEGIMTAREGDYLCKANTEEGEIWPVKKEIFEETYKSVEKVRGLDPQRYEFDEGA